MLKVKRMNKMKFSNEKTLTVMQILKFDTYLRSCLVVTYKIIIQNSGNRICVVFKSRIIIYLKMSLKEKRIRSINWDEEEKISKYFNV